MQTQRSLGTGGLVSKCLNSVLNVRVIVGALIQEEALSRGLLCDYEPLNGPFSSSSSITPSVYDCNAYYNYAQVDGEPWIQPAGDIVVLRSALKVTVYNQHGRYCMQQFLRNS